MSQILQRKEKVFCDECENTKWISLDENTGKGEKSMAKKVTVIKAAKAQKHTQEERRLKVCGYARVSNGSQAQATS